MKNLQNFKNLIDNVKNDISSDSYLNETSKLFIEAYSAHSIIYALWDMIANKYIIQHIFGKLEIDLKKIDKAEIDDIEFSSDNNLFTMEELKKNIPFLNYINHTNNKIKNIILIPLKYDNTPVALLIILKDNEIACKFNEYELDFLSFFCSSTFYNNRLKNESIQKSTKLATLYEMSKNRDPYLIPSNLLSSLSKALNSLIKFDVSLLFVVDKKSSKPVLGRITGDRLLVNDIINNPENYEINEVLLNKKPILFHHNELKSCLSVPIIFENNLFGILFAGTKKTYAYDSSDLISVSILASHFASIDSSLNKLLQIRNYSKAVLDAMKTGLIAIDNKGTITHMNMGAKNYLKIKNETEGLNYSEVLSEDSELYKQIDKALSSGTMVEDMEFSDLDNKKILEITTYPFKDSSGIRLGIAMLIRDVTTIRSMENQVRRSERLSALGELSASLAHEIRNPLTGIKMISQLLESEIINFDDKLLEHTQLQIKEIDRLEKIVTDMLNFARPPIPEIKECDLKKMINSLIFILKNKLEEKEIEINNKFDISRDYLCKCDCNQINQVLLNIIINSIEAIEKKGSISFFLNKNDDNFEIIVEDNGCGVDTSKLRKIFNPFFTTKESGTGLGLAIAHRIMEEHNGSIHFTSRLNEGSRVKIILPQ